MSITREQFERLALEQLDTLYRTARALAGPSAAEDLVQETLLRAMRAYGTFELREFGIRPWLLRILFNVHANRLEHEARQPAPVDGVQLETMPAPPAVAPGTSYDRDAVDERLARAIDSLSPDIRTVLLLWAVEDMSYKEIAAALGIPIGTVMSRLHRARQVLSGVLRGFSREMRMGGE